MPKIYYRKLIRDYIPQIIASRGTAFKIKMFDPKNFYRELLKKVGEEASGLIGAKNKKELVSELADVIDVIEEIKRYKKITSVQINKARQNNYHRKGGFRKKLFLVWTADDGYQTNERTNSR